MSPRGALVPVILLAFGLGAGSLHGQDVERERQAELAPELGIVEISAELRGRLGLFPEVEGFRLARLFLGEDGTAVLEIEFVREGVLHRERRTLSDVGLRAFRDDLSRLLEDRRFVFTQEGRGGLVLGQTLLGVAYHGWAVPAALGISSPQSGVATYLLTAGAMFYVPYRFSRDRTVTDVHRDVTMYGSIRGIVAGLLLGDLLLSDERPAHEDNRARVRFGGGVVGGIAGGLAGFYAVDRWAPDAGDGSLWGAFGDAGLIGGAVLGYALGPYAEEEVAVERDGFVGVETRARSRRAGHAITLAGHAAGLSAGAWLSERRTHSEGDVAALRSAGILGAQVGATVVWGTGVDEGRAIAGGVVGGGVGGLVLGDRFLAPRTLARGEGLLVNAGHIAGGAAALGLTYLAVGDIDEHPVVYLTASTLGSFAGAGLVWRAVASDADLRGRSGGTREASSPSGGGLEIRLDPAGAIAGSLKHAPGGRVRPWLTVRY